MPRRRLPDKDAYSLEPPGRVFRDSSLIEESAEVTEELDGWKTGLLAAVGVPDDELPFDEEESSSSPASKHLRVSVEIPVEMISVVDRIAQNYQPAMNRQQYLEHCLALALSQDLDEFYWITRTKLRIEGEGQ